MEKLTYKKISDSVIEIDLHNNYSVIAMKLFDYQIKTYKISFYIKNNNVETIEQIEDEKDVEFNTDRKTINSAILKYVAGKFEKDFYNYYIIRYEYMLKCFDKGNSIYESERLHMGDTYEGNN